MQREIDILFPNKSPKFFGIYGTWVSHLNGSADEIPEDNSRRSPFILPWDPSEIRQPALESNIAMSHIIWNQMFVVVVVVVVVVGLSFNYPCEEYLLKSISGNQGNDQDNLPVGESKWIIINSSSNDLNNASKLIKKYIPSAHIELIQVSFEQWVKSTSKYSVNYIPPPIFDSIELNQ